MQTQTGTANQLSSGVALSFATSDNASGSGYSPVFVVGPGRPSGERTADEAETGSRSKPQIQVTTHAIHRANLCLKRAIESIDTILGETDIILRANALDQFRTQLRKLWEMRTDREPAFAEFVNMLEMVFLDTRIADFTDAAMSTVKEVLQIAYDEEDFDDELNNELTERLIRGDLDVFRELI